MLFFIFIHCTAATLAAAVKLRRIKWRCALFCTVAKAGVRHPSKTIKILAVMFSLSGASCRRRWTTKMKLFRSKYTLDKL